jgi:protein SCO1/2
MKRLMSVCFALLFGLAAHAAPTPTPIHSPTSIYNLDVQLTNQAGKSHGLDVYRGKPLLITMFYGSCPMACPLLIDTVRAVERSVPEAQRKELRVLMISIDPEHDTPAALAKLAQERHIDTSRWTLASTGDKAVRKIAALLNIQYRKLPNGGYNHSSVVTVLSPQGEIAAQSAVMGKADEALTSAIAAMGEESVGLTLSHRALQ